MAYDIPGFLYRDVEALKFKEKDKTFIFYVPEKYFTTKNAVITGEYVSMLGLVNYEIIDNKSGKSTTGIKLFNFPTTFLCKPTVIEKSKDLQLNKNADPADYRLLKFEKDAEVVTSVKVPEDIINVEAFYGLFMRGNLPNTIPYNEVQNIVVENMRLNGYSYGITMQLIGVLISEFYRSSKDLDIPYRLSGSKDPLDYKTMDIRQIPKHISPFVSLTSENWDESVVGAITTKNQKESPMEKLLMD